MLVVSLASPEAYDRVVEEAVRTFESWRERPAPKRGELVRDLGNALRDAKEPLGDLVTLEMGKIRAEGHGEVQEMIDICDFAVGLSRQLYGLTLASERPGHRMMEQWHPLGPVGVITAFNFPVAVWAWNAALAAVCGDPVIWKPAEPTPLTAVAVQHIANRVMADHGVSGVFNLVVGPGATIGERMTARPSSAARSRSPVPRRSGAAWRRSWRGVSAARILELGGNNAIVVTEDARLDLAMRAIVFGAVGTAGQRCTTTRRLIVHRSIAQDAHDASSRRRTQQVPIGDPLDRRYVDGPARRRRTPSRRCSRRIDQAKAEGGEVDLRRRTPSGHRSGFRRADDRPHAGADRRREEGDVRADPLCDRVRRP